MKRLVALMLMILLSLSVLTACNDTTGTESETTSAEATVADTEVTAQQAEGATTTEATSGSQTMADATLQATETNTKGQNLADTEEFSIIITDCVTDANKGFVMYAEIENKTENPLVFKVTASALNNKDMHPDFTHEVPAYEKVNIPMVWSADKLAERLVTEVTEVKIELQVVSYGENVKMLSSDIYTINP